MKKIKSNQYDFGKRLSLLRKDKGLTQTELGAKIGISKRMVAYYEGQTVRPPANLLIPIAKALKVSVEKLLGSEKITTSDPKHSKIWRRLKKVELLSSKDQKILFSFLNSLLEKTKKQEV